MMETILVELPEPVVACLIKEARQKKVSVSELVAQRINRDFSFAVRTAQQAQRKALKILRRQCQRKAPDGCFFPGPLSARVPPG